MPKTQAVSHVRVSGQGQVRGDGPARQRRAIQRYASTHKIAVIEEFADLGVSGATELADRPGLAALLDRVEHNGVSLVLVERADRLARDLMIQEVTIDAFTRAGVRVVTSEGVDLTTDDGDPTRRLIRQILGAVSEFDKSVVVLKLRAARERIRRREGRCEGRKPYGYHPAEQARHPSHQGVETEASRGTPAELCLYRGSAQQCGTDKQSGPSLDAPARAPSGRLDAGFCFVAGEVFPWCLGEREYRGTSFSATRCVWSTCFRFGRMSTVRLDAVLRFADG